MTEETLTEEELAAQENPEILTEEEKAAAAAAEEEGEDAGLGDKTEEELAAEAAAKEAEGEGEGEGEVELTPEQAQELRTELAELKSRNITLDQNLRNMESKFAKYDKVLREANLLEEVDEDQQKEIEKADAGRKMFLRQIWETMEINPKYEDIAQVVTEHNKQLVISAYAEQLVEDDPSIEMSTAEIAVKQSIDELTNPYKFFYEQIKLIAKGGEDEEKAGKEKENISKKAAELKETPGSVNKMGGASKLAAGWTMTKLDEMSEEDMLKTDIPSEVYEQWKAGTLPK